MGRMLFFIVVIINLVIHCYGYSSSEIFESLNDEDKVHFLRYYIAKGFLDSQTIDSGMNPGINFPNDLPIPQDLADSFEKISIEPEDYPVKLLAAFTNKYNLSPDEALMVARKRCNCIPRDKYLCLPDGTCIDPGDVGSVCCT